MTLEELESENETLKATDQKRGRAFQVVIGQVKTGLQEAKAAIAVLPAGPEKDKAVSLLQALEARASSLLAGNYEGVMNSVQPESVKTENEAPSSHSTE